MPGFYFDEMTCCITLLHARQENNVHNLKYDNSYLPAPSNFVAIWPRHASTNMVYIMPHYN